MPMILPALAGVGGSFLGGLASKLPVVGNLVSGIGSLFGGGDSGGIEPIQAQRLNRSAARAARNQARSQWRRELRETRRQLKASFQQQKEFATHGIRWRVQDAKAAGLHPLFALGGSGAAFSPAVSIPSVSQVSPERVFSGGQAEFGPDIVGLGNALSAMGQNLMPPVAATQSPLENAIDMARLRELQTSARVNEIQAMKLASDMRVMSQPGRGHGAPLWSPRASSPVVARDEYTGLPKGAHAGTVDDPFVASGWWLDDQGNLMKGPGQDLIRLAESAEGLASVGLLGGSFAYGNFTDPNSLYGRLFNLPETVSKTPKWSKVPRKPLPRTAYLRRYGPT